MDRRPARLSCHSSDVRCTSRARIPILSRLAETSLGVGKRRFCLLRPYSTSTRKARFLMDSSKQATVETPKSPENFYVPGPLCHDTLYYRAKQIEGTTIVQDTVAARVQRRSAPSDQQKSVASHCSDRQESNEKKRRCRLRFDAGPKVQKSKITPPRWKDNHATSLHKLQGSTLPLWTASKGNATNGTKKASSSGTL
jgi:hypothetical protein